MKNLFRALYSFILIVTAAGCNSFDLDLQENPLAITPERANLNDVYNSVQLNFAGAYFSTQVNPGIVSRMYMGVADTYQQLLAPTDFDGFWTQTYAGFFPDINNVLLLSEENGLDVHAGTVKIMRAYVLLTIVDLFGSAPSSDALQGVEVISPTHDSGEQIYAEAIALLDEAIAQLSGTSATGPAYDNIYDGDVDKWVTAAKTIKLKAALNMGDAAAINSLIADGDLIDDATEDFQVNFGSQRDNPNSRHPFYNIHYEDGDGDYLSTYYMWLLRAEKVNASGVTIVDPRIRYYFYRKVDDSEGQDPTTYGCVFSLTPNPDAKPDHWDAVDPRLPYCIVSADGYIGRDHLNGSGIPPDGPIRTSYGLYPGGGQFDDDTFDDTRVAGTTGGLGEGIGPILVSSFTDFMLAEAALSLGTTGDARDLLESGIRKSLDKVESFESLVSTTMGQEVTLRDGSSGTIKQLFGMSEDDKDDYIAEVMAMYDAAADDDARLEIVIKEYYIAAWGNGLEAYNMFRRTGFPSNVQPSLQIDPGQFPNTMLLPTVHVTRNQNIDQKTFAVRPFWMDPGLQLF